MAILKNKTRQPQVFNLDAPFFVKNANETPYGRSCSLTLMALEKREVHDAVLACEEIKCALAKNPPVLRLLKAPEMPTVIPKPAKTTKTKKIAFGN